MTAEPEIDLTAGRRRVARSRGALSGVLLVVLGAWAALVPFIGPYFDLGFRPRPDDAWHWTSGRGLYELLPGGVAVLAGLLLLLSASRLLTVLAAWVAALAGVWLVIGPSLAELVGVEIGGPGSVRPGVIAAETLLYFFATGAAIVLVAGVALGRLSTHSVRDVRAAERRAEAEAAEEQRRVEELRAAAEAQRLRDEQSAASGADVAGAPTVAPATDERPHEHSHERPHDHPHDHDPFRRRDAGTPEHQEAAAPAAEPSPQAAPTRTAPPATPYVPADAPTTQWPAPAGQPAQTPPAAGGDTQQYPVQPQHRTD